MDQPDEGQRGRLPSTSRSQQEGRFYQKTMARGQPMDSAEA